MHTFNEFLAEIETTFANFTESNDIDRISIKGWVISCLREFGKNICDKSEAIIEIKNSQGNLPEGFKSLRLALNLEGTGYKILGDREKAKESTVYRQRIEQSGYYDFSSNTFVSDCNAKEITESIIANNQEIQIFHKPTYLSVVKGFKKESFDAECLNLHPSIRNKYPNQININNRTMQTNFKEGRIYIQYNSLPSDEDNEIVIPTFTTGDLYKYIENYVKLKIAENLILNGKNATNVQGLMQMWASKEREYRIAAKSECNYAGLDNNWHKRYNKLLQANFNKYNLPKL